MRFILSAFLIFSFSIYSYSQDFIRREGTKLLKGDQEILLSGISFGNRVWDNDALPDEHHKEADYARVAGMGMNAIRFYMNYLTFEDNANPYVYKQAGWDWIDQNIQWAKNNNIYLMLNMHVPQGGFQSQCNGAALWNEEENQNRLVALWKAIAEHYKDEPQIAGFDILNEPTPKDSVEQWYALAERIVNGIREVDNNHLIITERAIAVDCDYSSKDENNNYPVLSETNLMYTVHLYDPYEYTHQNQAWAGTGDGGTYPDPDRITAPADLTWAVGQYTNPKLPAGNSDWKFFRGTPFSINTDTLILARPVYYAHSLGEGLAYYDSFIVEELNSSNQVIGQIAAQDFTSKGDVYLWSEHNDGVLSSSTSSPTDNFSLTVTGTSGYGTINAQAKQFRVEKGKKYRISGYMKGENIPSNAVASATMEFYYSPSGKEVSGRDKAYLEEAILDHSEYPRQHGYPVYFGEFGVVKVAFGEKGGQNWVADVLDIFDSLDFHFTYHVYREDAFGLYGGTTGLVNESTRNDELHGAFTDFFSTLSPVKKKVEDKSTGMFYPNPFNESFHLKGENVSDFIIYDHLGNSVFSKKMINNEKNLGKNLLPGMYFLHYKVNGMPAVEKIIKR